MPSLWQCRPLPISVQIQSSKHCVRGIHTQVTQVSPACINESNEYDDQSEDGFLGAVTSETSLQNQWLVTVVLNCVLVKFNIDTGADVTVITEDLYHQVESSSLTVPDQALKGANNRSLSVKRICWLLFYYYDTYVHRPTML